MSERDPDSPGQDDSEARPPRSASPFLRAVSGAGEAAAGAAGSTLGAAAELVSGVADALEDVVAEVAGPEAKRGDEREEDETPPREPRSPS